MSIILKVSQILDQLTNGGKVCALSKSTVKYTVENPNKEEDLVQFIHIVANEAERYWNEHEYSIAQLLIRIAETADDQRASSKNTSIVEEILNHGLKSMDCHDTMEQIQRNAYAADNFVDFANLTALFWKTAAMHGNAAPAGKIEKVQDCVLDDALGQVGNVKPMTLGLTIKEKPIYAEYQKCLAAICEPRTVEKPAYIISVDGLQICVFADINDSIAYVCNGKKYKTVHSVLKAVLC